MPPEPHHVRELEQSFPHPRFGARFLPARRPRYSHPPALRGGSTLASTESGTGARKWSEGPFFEQVRERLTDAEAARVRELYDWALGAGEVRFSTTSDLAAFNVVFPQVSRNRFFKLLSDGTLVLPLSRLGNLESRLRAELRAAGFDVPDDAKKPMVPLSEWRDRTHDFIGAITRCIDS